MHFGLGEATGAEVVRITGRTASLQAEFDTQADQAIAATQRLKGSCPWLFAWNGREMAFVTDLLWRSPLGLRINAQATADVLMTEDWVRSAAISSRRATARTTCAITAELWETHFFDLVSLMVVDHPDGHRGLRRRALRGAAADARRSIATGPVQPFAARARRRGRDVSELASRARRPLPRLRRPRRLSGHHARLTSSSSSCPTTAPRTGPLWLVAQGWIHPTDSSINVAIGQGTHDAARGPRRCRSPTRAGASATCATGLGFPAGKDKTILIDLDGRLPAERTAPPAPARRTSRSTGTGWAGRSAGRTCAIAAAPARAASGGARAIRGYSVTEQPTPSVAGAPALRRSAAPAPRWRDLDGYYTRFGDVRELLRTRRRPLRDHERRRRAAAALPGGAAAARRAACATSSLVGDGWEKDGDYNTTFSRPCCRCRRTRAAATTRRRGGSRTIPSTGSTRTTWQSTTRGT